MQEYLAQLKAGSAQHKIVGKVDAAAFAIRPIDDSDASFTAFQPVAETAITRLSAYCFVLPHADSDRSIPGYDLVLIDENCDPR